MLNRLAKQSASRSHDWQGYQQKIESDKHLKKYHLQRADEFVERRIAKQREDARKRKHRIGRKDAYGTKVNDRNLGRTIGAAERRRMKDKDKYEPENRDWGVLIQHNADEFQRLAEEEKRERRQRQVKMKEMLDHQMEELNERKTMAQKAAIEEGRSLREEARRTKQLELQRKKQVELERTHNKKERVKQTARLEEVKRQRRARLIMKERMELKRIRQNLEEERRQQELTKLALKEEHARMQRELERQLHHKAMMRQQEQEQDRRMQDEYKKMMDKREQDRLRELEETYKKQEKLVEIGLKAQKSMIERALEDERRAQKSQEELERREEEKAKERTRKEKEKKIMLRRELQEQMNARERAYKIECKERYERSKQDAIMIAKSIEKDRKKYFENRKAMVQYGRELLTQKVKDEERLIRERNSKATMDELERRFNRSLLNQVKNQNK